MINNRRATLESTIDVGVACTPSTSAVEVLDLVAAGVTARPGLISTTRRLQCPTGWEIAGGGFRLPAFTDSVILQASLPIPTVGGEGWFVTVSNRGTSSATFDAYAVCVRLLPLI